MYTISQCIQPYISQNIENVSSSYGPIKSFIENKNINFLSYDQALDFYTFNTLDSDDLLKSLSFDINRMSIASFESFYSLKNRSAEYPKSISWLLIKLYYSAFFSAHSILRILGKPVLQIDQRQSLILNKQISFHTLKDQIPKIENKIYILATDITTYINLKSCASRNSHEELWKLFLNELILIETNVNKNNFIDQDSKNNFKNQLDSLSTILCSYGRSHGNWLSSIRNEINYQHLYDAWFPHSRTKTVRDKIYENLSRWDKEPYINISNKSHDLDKFSQACIFIIALNKNLIETVQQMNSKCFFNSKYGVKKVISTIYSV